MDHEINFRFVGKGKVEIWSAKVFPSVTTKMNSVRDISCCKVNISPNVYYSILVLLMNWEKSYLKFRFIYQQVMPNNSFCHPVWANIMERCKLLLSKILIIFASLIFHWFQSLVANLFHPMCFESEMVAFVPFQNIEIKNRYNHG